MLLTATFLLPVLLFSQECEGFIRLSNQAEVDAFNCTTITGDLMIDGADITNLNGLSSLTTVSSELFIWNTSLTTLDLPSSLTNVGNFDIRRNSLLTRIDNINDISETGNLFIIGNPMLTDLDGLSNISRVEELFIIENHSLVNIDGIASLNTIVDTLSIIQNNSLEEINALSTLTHIGGNIKIWSNSVLSEFCGLHTLFDSDGFDGRYTVVLNAENPTQEDILAGGPCDLDDPIEDLLSEGTLNTGQANALWAKLERCNLRAFQQQVNALVRSRRLTAEEADALLDFADQTCGSARKSPYQYGWELEQNYPNPSQTFTELTFSLPTNTTVSIKLYDMTGKLVKILQEGSLSKGKHTIRLNTQDLSDGVYFYTLQSRNFSQTKSMVVRH